VYLAYEYREFSITAYASRGQFVWLPLSGAKGGRSYFVLPIERGGEEGGEREHGLRAEGVDKE